MLLGALETFAQSTRAQAGCRYDVPFDDRIGIREPFRLSGRTRTDSVIFYTERARVPAEGSEIRLVLRHSPDLDGARSFISVNLNYALLRSLRLEYKTQTEIVIPIAPDLLHEKNELTFSVQHFPADGRVAPELWTEIDQRSSITIRCRNGKPALDLVQLPYPMLDPHGPRGQKINLIAPEKLSTETIEAIALLVANLSNRVNRTAMVFDGVLLVRSIRSASEPLLIAGTPDEQGQLAQLTQRFPALRNVAALRPYEGIAGLFTLSERSLTPILVLSANRPSGVLTAARGLFGLQFEEPAKFARIGSTTAPSPGFREWHGFAPPKAHFSLEELGYDDGIRIRPGARGSVVLPLRTSPDSRFLSYGLQARLTLDLRQTAGSPATLIEVLLNGRSLGEFAVPDISTGSRASLRVNAPASVLQPENVLNIVWRHAEKDGELDGEGRLLESSEFYLPRYYETQLPDLALLRKHFFPFSVTPNLSDTVIVIPDTVDEEVTTALMDLSISLGRFVPSKNLAFQVRRYREHTAAPGASSNYIILEVNRAKGRNPFIEQFPSAMNPRRFVLRFTAASTAALRQTVQRFFSDGVFNRLEGDTVLLSTAQPVMRKTVKQITITEHHYLDRLEAWLRSNWIALPVILGMVSILMFAALRLSLNQYRSRSNGAV
jgi:hypothetical protein